MKRITATEVTPWLTVLSGPGVRDLLTDLTGRSPMWCSRPRGWAVQPHTAADLLALAETRGYVSRVVTRPAAAEPGTTETGGQACQ